MCARPANQAVQDSDMHPAGTCWCCTVDIPLACGPSDTSFVCKRLQRPGGRNQAIVPCFRGEGCGRKFGSSVSFRSLQGIIPARERASCVDLPPLAMGI